MWVFGVAASLLAAALGTHAQDIASECPAPNGFFADAVQCDKYYHCEDNVLTEKLCADGLGFNDINPAVEKCDLLPLLDCSGRTQLQQPQPTENCERQNGNFPVAGSNDCNTAYRCQAGVGSLISCPEGLAFALDTGICDWPDQSKRAGCSKDDTKNFTCPKVSHDEAVAHPRYADPLDCQYFYVCINGKTARRNGCKFGQVFNSLTKACDLPKEVPDCADYYTQFFDDHFNLVAENPLLLSQDILSAAILSGYPVPFITDRVRITPGGSKRVQSADETPAAETPPTRRGPTRASPGRTSRPEPAGRQPGGGRQQPGAERPQRRRRPGIRRKKTTTTTSTTTPPPEYYDDYYYYDDEEVVYEDAATGPTDDIPNPAPADAAAPATAAAPVRAPSRFTG